MTLAALSRGAQMNASSFRERSCSVAPPAQQTKREKKWKGCVALPASGHA
jgi:hypothetical protein